MKFGEVNYDNLNSIAQVVSGAQDRWLSNSLRAVEKQKEDDDKKKANEIAQRWAEIVKGGKLDPDVLMKAAIEARSAAAGGGEHTQKAAEAISQDAGTYVRMFPPKKDDLSLTEDELRIIAANPKDPRAEMAKTALEQKQKDKLEIARQTQIYTGDRQVRVDAAKPATFTPGTMTIGADGKWYIPVTNKKTGQTELQETNVDAYIKQTNASMGNLNVGELDGLKNMFDLYMSNMDEIPTGRIGGNLASFFGWLGVNTESANAANITNATRQILGRRVVRVIGGERGVTTDRDASAGEAMVPAPSDNITVREMKAKQLNNLIIARRKAFAAGYKGRIPPTNVEPDKPPKVEGLDAEDMKAFFDTFGFYPESAIQAEDAMKESGGF